MLILKYGFYITMSVLAITNMIFFICGWKNLQIDISNEALLLSVVGFFFAFAGINIYSIFNTNIETEKSRLLELADKYDNELQLSSSMLRFPQEIIMIFQSAQYLTSACTLQPNSYDLINEIRTRLTDQKEFIQGLKDSLKNRQYEHYKADLTSLATGVEQILRQHKKNISYNGFFTEQKDQEDNYNSKLDKLIEFVEDLKYYEYEDTDDDELPLDFKSKCKKVFLVAKDTFCKK